MNAALTERIDALLPQTQCTKCGFEGCRPYAEALAAGRAAINRCPPGGDAGIRRLSALLGRPHEPLDPACGRERPREVAVIDEAHCIGCTLCIQACPVDAILGARRQMHTVLISLCSGCDLCIAPCPVDCIAMRPASGDDAIWDAERARAARERYTARRSRLAREREEREARQPNQAPETPNRAQSDRRKTIEAAIERARARRAAGTRPANHRPREGGS